MRWMIASDIHGSYKYCKKLIEAYEKEEASRLILLGDILYHGPRNDIPEEYAPKKVIELLNQRKKDILCIRGNCDTEVDQMVLDFPILADYAIFTQGNLTVYATHGHHYNVERPLPMKERDILLYGHTHIPMYQYKDGIHYMNPGSVSIPKAGSQHGYIIWEENQFFWKDLEGNTLRQVEV
ncbi:MAG: phosphodiesterase [Firmicutes bacterium]|nr:phosphodiesterase [Bacillota bacterium]